MNQLNIIGNMTSDPTLRQAPTATGTVPVLNFTLAVNDLRDRTKPAVFFNCTAWRSAAEVIAKYMRKGSKMRVTGPVSIRTYQTSNGETRANLDVQVESFEFLSKVEAQETHEETHEPLARDPGTGYQIASGDDLPF